MEYRRLQRGTEEISIIGIGTSSIGQGGALECAKTAEMAIENGINYFDLAAGDAVPFTAFTDVIAGCRDKVYLQVHFGPDYSSGEYSRTNELEAVKRGFDWQMNSLKTDYVDFGFVHCVDEMNVLEQIIHGGVLDYIKEMKKQGVVRHIALSSHTPAIVNRLLDLDVLDMLMFSINPAYDYRHGDYAYGEVDERMAMYRRCESMGVGISVMKPFGGGKLLKAETSPLKHALTEYQCLQYALDKLGVLTTLPGVRNREDLKRVLGFLKASPEEKDYSVLGTLAPQDAKGVCVYCNHCQPCPAGLNVGLINKYYDLACVGDLMAKDHYMQLNKHAEDCVGCGHCNSTCPFHVNQVQRMQEIKDYFGK